MKKLRKILLIIMSALFLFFAGSSKKNYLIAGLPDPISEGMRTYLYDEMFYFNKVPMPQTNELLFASFVLEDSDYMHFFEMSESNFQEEYNRLIRPGSGSLDFLVMQNSMNTNHFSYVEPNEVDLPNIQMQDNRHLHITNEEEQIRVDLEKMGKDNLAIGTFFINIVGNTTEDILMDISSLRISERLLVFLKKDLSSYVVVKVNETDIEAAYASGELDPYESLFEPLGSTEQFNILSHKDGTFILNTEKKDIVSIDEDDKLSVDGKKVLVHGASPEAGVQQVQKTEDYLAEKDTAQSFVLNSHAIANVGDLKNAKELVDLKVIYFKEHLLIYSLRYHGHGNRIHFIVDLDQQYMTPYVFKLY